MTSPPVRDHHDPKVGLPTSVPFPPPPPYAWPTSAPTVVSLPILTPATPTSTTPAPLLPSLRSTLHALAHTEFTPIIRYPALHVGFPAALELSTPLTYTAALSTPAQHPTLSSLPSPLLHPAQPPIPQQAAPSLSLAQQSTHPSSEPTEVKTQSKDNNDWVLDLLAEMSSGSNPNSSPLPVVVNLSEPSPAETARSKSSEPSTAARTPKKPQSKGDSPNELVFVNANDKDKVLSRRRRPIAYFSLLKSKDSFFSNSEREKELMAELSIDKLLTTHKRTDQGYQCDRCAYTTPQIGNLQQHLYSHEGIRPFKCSECDYASSFSSAIVRHRQVHEQGKRFQCPSCDYCVKQNYNLRRHLARSHQMSTKEAMETVKAISLSMAGSQKGSSRSASSEE